MQIEIKGFSQEYLTLSLLKFLYVLMCSRLKGYLIKGIPLIKSTKLDKKVRERDERCSSPTKA